MAAVTAGLETAGPTRTWENAVNAANDTRPETPDGHDDDLDPDDLDLPVANRDMSGPAMGWLLIAFGLVGFVASIALAIEKFLKLSNPNHVASCSINIFLDCADAMASWQGALLGFPNPFIGVAAFPVVVTTGVVLLLGVTLPRWYWLCLFAGTVAALGLVIFLIYTSVSVLGKLCPYCMVVWAAVIPLFWFTLVYAVQERVITVSDGLRSALVRNRVVLLVGLYAVVVAWVLIVMGPAIADHIRMS
ncbi:vitamin K epoxide reductase family protein [Sanguibacter gelidistatuariae]|nr:vitamin K epoxide reductase family protein [Sanguibacter gelidistatuariae]